MWEAVHPCQTPSWMQQESSALEVQPELLVPQPVAVCGHVDSDAV